MAKYLIHRRKIAITLLLILGINLLLPCFSYALTSGPAQPETKGFQVATVSDMVDLSSGGLKYNIPLLDIDGYPINLSYQSGSGMDDEASWVGEGWSCNPGAINRQVRGLPDDFSGDAVETDHYVKPKVTVGGRLTAKTEAFGIAHASGSFTFGIFNDNYTGIGAELGVNAGISISTPNDGLLTAGLGAGVLSNTQSGVDASISPYVSMSVKANADDNFTINSGRSASFGYNTRAGLKGLTLGQSFGASNYDQEFNFNTLDWDPESGSANYNVAGSTITYNTEPISPTIKIPYSSTYSSFSFDVGGAAVGIFGSLGGTGYQNVRQVQNIYNIKPAFGFLYAERGINNQDAVMDFFREKDNPMVPGIPNIALPVHTPDIWSFTSQTGSGEFRLYRGGSGAFFDNQEADVTSSSTLGGDLGFGAWFHGGITNYNQNGKTTTRKWTNNNSYLPNGDFQQDSTTNPKAEHVYFRVIGEKNIEDQDMDNRLAGTQPLEVNIQGMSATNALRKTGNLYGTPNVPVNSPIAKTSLRPNRTVISYLTAVEASKGGLYKLINNYAFINTSGVNMLLPSPVPLSSLPRFDSTKVDSLRIHKPHHISQITATDESGKRMVYGIPVYNISQDEYSFAIDTGGRDTDHLVTTPPGITSPTGDPNGIDHYYHRERKPAYATSFLLTAILSPDYVDKTGDGITDDDLGTAIKFNYSKVSYPYKWRTPYLKATPNRCLLADPDDDKGSIVYGKKEIWYIQSIESKTKIAYFITANRSDALGALNWQNGGRDLANVQKCLVQIRLYSKADMSKPIKIVKFQYDYSLCRGVKNSADLGSTDPTKSGKLTLKRVYFEYGNSTKGMFHPYVFQYNTQTNGGHITPGYGNLQTDRWGIYKDPSENANKLDNEQYPYADQNKAKRDSASALWQLSQITLPTGGYINITYESGDYAYVQNQKAMAMTPIESLIWNSSQLNDTTRKLTKQVHGLRLDIRTGSQPPSDGVQTQWFENTYLNGSAYMYTKLYVNMMTPNDISGNTLPYDAVPTYCHIDTVKVVSGHASVIFTPVTAGSVTAGPISICAWQRMKNEYPRYAYPGFENRIATQNNSVLAAVSAIVNAARNLSELREGFYEKADSRGYASQVVLGQSYVKLVQTNGFKLGGPARVKKIQIWDNWKSVNASSANVPYGQSYTYTTTDNGQTISSGVAAYEPSVGNDENALKQPVPYMQNIKGAINNYFDLETPFGESFYPAPSICYSKVTVNDLDQTGAASKLTGSIVNEYYTFKDFPVVVNVLPLIPSPERNGSYYSLTRSNSDDELCYSQGYAIQLNDMQGKTKATTVYDQAGAIISATQYYYSSQNNGGTMSLNNKVNVIDPATMLVTPKILGQDVDFFTDFREQETSNTGQTINVGGDIFPVPFWPFFGLPHLPVNDNDDYKLFRSVCAVKVIQNYGILTKVVKTENGSTIATENLAFDQMTGEPLITRTQNEFQQYIYSVNIPAYWVYTRMGAAYQNLGIVLSGLKTNTNGELTSFTTYLQAGDEILDTGSGNMYWVINNLAASGSGTTMKLIDRNGILKTGYTFPSLVKVVRSGYRNMLTANTSSLVTLSNPITAGNQLNLLSTANLAALKVINTSATTFDESWGMAKPNIAVKNTSYVFTMWKGDTDTLYCHNGALIQTVSPGDTVLRTDTLWKGSINHRAGIWFAEDPLADVDNWMGFETCLNITIAKTYFFGYAADNGIQVFLDGSPTPVITADTASQSSYSYWHIVPVSLTSGSHVIKVRFMNRGNAGDPYNPATAGLEIYNNTAATLLNPSLTIDSLKIIFSTQSLKGIQNIQSFRTVDSNEVYHFTQCGSPMQICTPNFQTTINPYISGFLGNWRPFQTKVFQQNRNYSFAGAMTSAAITVKKAGYLKTFYPYWYFNTGAKKWVLNTNGTSWVTANTVTLYDKYGQQQENVDALGRFSAANFDFNGELPAAVASNAMNREIYAASFEDSYFVPGSGTATDTCNRREFIEPATGKTIKQLASNMTAHSGNYSALLPSDGVTLSTIIDTLHQKVNPYLGIDASKQYITQTTAGLYPNGFEPYPGKQYLFDAWVRDGRPTDKNVNLSLSINGNTVPLKCKAVVEGWKLIEGTMNLATLGHAPTLNISILPNSGFTIYIDDIRMHPFQALMKTYAYDARTMRLMAEIDENGFATFYEYDDEGLLIRVKKETEKGVMTLKESRSTYKKSN
ncbi:hypothetical protein [Mucilaginibacter gotjawali]|uniref:PA14 domain-containing protein n=1 Tax=Mucilaginibacter gotjawali TaxID=1550579 RepID=A0A839SIQ0_9SPHI|nr:hypothetical protein [Mucilaginibacter gotjawali]MBB3056750.1 hypothetical protein [Mucilaginibacter gotjawali]